MSGTSAGDGFEDLGDGLIPVLLVEVDRQHLGTSESEGIRSLARLLEAVPSASLGRSSHLDISFWSIEEMTFGQSVT